MIAWLLLACAPPDEAVIAAPIDPFGPPGEPGPFAPGVTTRDIPDPRGGTLTVEIWYPATPDPGHAPDPYDEIPIVLQGIRDVPPVPGPWPMVGFSHGHGGIRYQSASLTEHLATHGFVVVAPDHVGAVLLDIQNDRMADQIVRRPDDVRFAIDGVLALAADDPLAGVALDGAYVQLGHSFGAVTTLALAGAVPDFSGTTAWCDAHDEAGCDFLPEMTDDMGVGHGTHDDRVIAAAAMAPGGWYAFGADGIGLRQTAPTLVLSGDRDSILPYAAEQVALWERLSEPTWQGTLARAGHYGPFSDLCLILPFYEDCPGEEKDFLSSEAGQRVVRELVTAFVGVHHGDARYQPWLDTEARSEHPDLRWDQRLP